MPIRGDELKYRVPANSIEQFYVTRTSIAAYVETASCRDAAGKEEKGALNQSGWRWCHSLRLWLGVQADTWIKGSWVPPPEPMIPRFSEVSLFDPVAMLIFRPVYAMAIEMIFGLRRLGAVTGEAG